ncbi:MAG: YdcF family protein [Brumimicrobium sp.]|nr:YdcF family protein [Brumimicrobium sp.]
MLIISKIVYFFIAPLSWVIIAILVWIFSKNQRVKKIAKISALFVLFFFSNTFIFKEVTRVWEIHAVKKESISHYEVAIVLSGMFEYDNDVKRLSARRGADRLWQTLDLYYAGKIDKILLSGGSGYVFDKGLNEAAQVRDLLVSWGISSEDIMVESASRNTYENAKFSAELLKKGYPKYTSFLLVTSARHMRRSKALFEKQGIMATPFSTDEYTGEKRYYTWNEYIIPDGDTFNEWFGLLKEMVGLAAYKIVGKA